MQGIIYVHVDIATMDIYMYVKEGSMKYMYIYFKGTCASQNIAGYMYMYYLQNVELVHMLEMALEGHMSSMSIVLQLYNGTVWMDSMHMRDLLKCHIYLHVHVHQSYCKSC